MTSFVCVRLIIAMFLVVLAENKEWKDHTKISELKLSAKWDETLNRTNAFQCGSPQPRSFTFRDLYKGDDENGTRNSIIQPWAVPLYRCESAGCCSTGYHCALASQELVTIVFKIYERKPRYVEVEVRNDISCSCQKNTDKIK